ncbi:Aldo/keto reductase [Aspergillus ellipticus CBS 707.79]|uniref:Aldo/keto reductase n=1 Tax=Aspergillus ellipticus CBS 707.79 TaxID=1448320 RepID=A0A319D1F0_9EURO|nr:Aldo/keto reductase [Aspergillus ellipticus CBS 707.79]
MAMNKLPSRPLGTNGPLLPHIGLGLMGASGTYGPRLTEAEHLAFLDEAYERGETFWDTADKYNSSETTLGKWFQQSPHKRSSIFLAIKFGICTPSPDNPAPTPGQQYWMNSSPTYCRTALSASRSTASAYLTSTYTTSADWTKTTPIEQPMHELVALKNEGKIRYIGLSECSAASLRRAHGVHPIACGQSVRVLQTARGLGVAVVAYSPLGNGILAGRMRGREDLRGDDPRGRVLPWLREENIEVNLGVVRRAREMAERKDVFVIPGSRAVGRLLENLAAGEVRLEEGEESALRALGEEVLGGQVSGLNLGLGFADTPAL